MVVISVIPSVYRRCSGVRWPESASVRAGKSISRRRSVAGALSGGLSGGWDIRHGPFRWALILIFTLILISGEGGDRRYREGHGAGDPARLHLADAGAVRFPHVAGAEGEREP